MIEIIKLRNIPHIYNNYLSILRKQFKHFNLKSKYVKNLNLLFNMYRHHKHNINNKPYNYLKCIVDN